MARKDVSTSLLIKRAIIFPYVDMNNDIEKYGYPQRAFLEYGTGIKRTHFIPAFSVQKFLEYVGDYLSTTGFPTCRL